MREHFIGSKMKTLGLSLTTCASDLRNGRMNTRNSLSSRLRWYAILIANRNKRDRSKSGTLKISPSYAFGKGYANTVPSFLGSKSSSKGMRGMHITVKVMILIINTGACTRKRFSCSSLPFSLFLRLSYFSCLLALGSFSRESRRDSQWDSNSVDGQSPEARIPL